MSIDRQACEYIEGRVTVKSRFTAAFHYLDLVRITLDEIDRLCASEESRELIDPPEIGGAL